MERPTCGTCAYWLREDTEWGICKRYPPGEMRDVIPVNQIDGSRGGTHALYAITPEAQPNISSDDWCGEHPDFPEYIKSLKNGPSTQAD